MKTIRVASRQEVERVTWNHWWRVISITDPGREDAKITGTFDENILRLSFTDDVAPGPHAVLFSDAQAKMIAEFVSKGTTFVVHCEAGICRSAGVADALRAFGFKWVNADDRIWSVDEGWINKFHPNVHVKVTLMRAMFLHATRYE